MALPGVQDAGGPKTSATATGVEIGKGPGYSTALIANRLGGDLVNLGGRSIHGFVAARAAAPPSSGRPGRVRADCRGDGLAGHK